MTNKHKCSNGIPTDVIIEKDGEHWYLMENLDGVHTVARVYFCPFCGEDLRLKTIKDIRSIKDVDSCPLVHRYSGMFGVPYIGTDGCYGYAQGPGDDEPCEVCKGCHINNTYEGDEDD